MIYDERIFLSKDEKIILTYLNEHDKINAASTKDVGIPQCSINVAAKKLLNKNLILGCVNDEGVLCIYLSSEGQNYLLKNPRLKNKISDTTKWIIGLSIAIVTSVASIIVQLLLAC